MIHTTVMAGGSRKPKTKYNLLADARKVMTEPSEHTDKGHVFTLHLMEHYHEFGGENTFPVTTHSNVAPTLMDRDILQLIMTLVDTRTASEVLKARQRFMTVHEVRDFGVDKSEYTYGMLHNDFPSIAPINYPYRRLYKRERSWNDVLCVHFEQTTNNMTIQNRLWWSVSVDLKQIYISTETKSLDIPARAVTVKTNVEEVRYKHKLSDRIVNEMLGFRFNTTISNDGQKITFCSDTGLGFVMEIDMKFAYGRRLESYKGIAKGDSVKIVKTYQAFDFAVGLTGVVHTIQVLGRVMFCVKFGKRTSAISRQMAEVNNRKSLYPDQPPHCLACQISHVQKI
jgi:hypothetical protein